MAGETVFEREESKPDKWRLIRGTNLKTEDRHVLLTLFLFQGDNGAAFCKQETLADEIGVSARSIRKSLNRLNAAGIVVSEWKLLNGVPMRHYAIQFDVLKTVQRGDGRNHSSDPETCSGRNHSSAPVGTTVPDHQEPQFLHEDPLNIQRTSTLGNSPNSPLPTEISGRKSGKEINPRLIAFSQTWNIWHSEGIVRQKIRDTDPPGKTIVDAWNRSQRDTEQRERLDDLPKLRNAIVSSQEFLKSAGWFDAAGLLGGKNGNRRWYAEQLLAGVYRDKVFKSGSQSGVDDSEAAWLKALPVVRSLDTSQPYKAKLVSEFGEHMTTALMKVGVLKIQSCQSDFERRERLKEFRHHMEAARCQ